MTTEFENVLLLQECEIWTLRNSFYTLGRSFCRDTLQGYLLFYDSKHVSFMHNQGQD